MQKFLNEYINEDYKEWTAGDIILISASTGTGKSHFILHDLLRYAIMQNKKILYLVNRKILKKQIDTELQTSVAIEMSGCGGVQYKSIKQYIDIMTYQSIEKRLVSNNLRLDTYDYVVYDECHYFYADSSYNTYTQISYDLLRHCYNNAVQIFMSATIDSMRKRLYEVFPQSLEYNPEFEFSPVRKRIESGESRIRKEYNIERDNSHLKLYLFEDDKQMLDIIEKSIQKEKWLIFVDSIDKGRELKRLLIENSEKQNVTQEDVVFIDADYESDSDAMEAVGTLAREKTLNQRIVIATSVLDNGISIHDKELRNLVIMADTEEEFIQMLGRKRKDGEKVNLYIGVSSKKHFEQRLYHVEKILRFYEYFADKIYAMYRINQTHRSLNMEPVWMNYYSGKIEKDWLICSTTLQQEILAQLLASEDVYRFVKKFIYCLNGKIAINNFAIEKYRVLAIFYQQMAKRLEIDRWAYVKKQAEWLRISQDEVEQAILDFTMTKDEKFKELLEEGIKEILNQEMSKDECSEWRIRYRECIKYFFEINDALDDKVLKHITRKDGNALSKETFNKCMEYAGLPYEMETSKKGGIGKYIIKKVEEIEENKAN